MRSAGLFVPGVDFHTEALTPEELSLLPAVIRSPVGDGEKPHLLRHHPGGESPGVFLDEVGKRPLVAAQRGPMDDVGQGFFAGFVVVSLRQLPKCISVFFGKSV